MAKEYMLEEIITKSIQIPGVKVSRDRFLAEEFASHCKNLEEIIEKGPVAAGIEQKKIDEIADKLILKRTSQSSVASFVAGIPGGFAMAATIPADILQFFGMSLKLAQELSYIYGAEDLWKEGKVSDEKVKNQLILYCGVMFGVSGAVSGLRVLSTQIAKTTLKKLPQKALTKTFWYPMLKKITSQIGIKMTKTTLAQGVSKAVPIIGGVISGSLNFASMMPMAKRLKDAFDKASFDYSDEEFLMDIENMTTPINEVEEKNTMQNIKNKLSTGVDLAKKGTSQLASKLKGNKNSKVESDPYEEMKKAKELLDMGIITQEEFDKKKKDLLNL